MATLFPFPHNGEVPSLIRRRLLLIIVMGFTDIIGIAAGFIATGYLYKGAIGAVAGMRIAQFMNPLVLVIGLYEHAYSTKALQNLRFSCRRAATAFAISGLMFALVAFLTQTASTYSRVIAAVGCLVSLALILAGRMAINRFIHSEPQLALTNVLCVDAGGPPVQIEHAYRVNADFAGITPDLDDPHSLDRLGRYLANMDRVIISCPLADRALWAEAMRAAGVRGELVTDRMEPLKPLGLVIEPGWAALVVSTGPLTMQQRAIKRAFDILFASLILLLTAPLMLVIALAIKLEDGGPILFVQPRMGRGNRLFSLYKFRSMRQAEQDVAGAQSTRRDDDRLTVVGRLIRRLSMDELPQLLNVLSGNMSVVGPRPHALGSQAGRRLFWQVERDYWQRHALRPGLTGLAQIRGLRGATEREGDLTQRLSADLEYINGWSLGRDLLIIFRTLKVVIHERAF